MSDDAVLVLEIGNERAHFEHAFPRLEVAWLETSAGDDQVLLVERARLRPERLNASQRRRTASARRVRPAKIAHARSQPGLAAPRRQARARRRQRHPQPGRKGRPGRPQRRRQVLAVRAAQRHACTPTAATSTIPPHWRIGAGRAGHARDRRRARPTSCSQGDTAPAEARRPSWSRAEASDDGHAHGARPPWRCSDAGGFDAPAARAGAAPRPGLQGRPSSTRRSTASRAAGACACSWRAR